MAPDNETQKPSHVGSRHTLLGLDTTMPDGRKEDHNNNKKNTTTTTTTTTNNKSFHEKILSNSLLDQARPTISLISEKVEELGTVASNTLASVREWSQQDNCGDDDDDDPLSNQATTSSSNTAIRFSAELAACCKPGGHNFDDSETVFTYETVDHNKHAKMIQRLSSWNTLETATTADEQGEAVVGVGQHQELSQQQQQQQQAKRRVQFDYPPVKAMSEIPRVNSSDIPSLFYSENELRQLRGDRISTISSEDVESVVIHPPSQQPKESRHRSTSRSSNATSDLLLENNEFIGSERNGNGNENNSPSSSQSKVRLLSSSTGRPIRE